MARLSGAAKAVSKYYTKIQRHEFLSVIERLLLLIHAKIGKGVVRFDVDHASLL